MGIMEKKMETTIIIGLRGFEVLGFGDKTRV